MLLIRSILNTISTAVRLFLNMHPSLTAQKWMPLAYRFIHHIVLRISYNANSQRVFRGSMSGAYSYREGMVGNYFNRARDADEPTRKVINRFGATTCSQNGRACRRKTGVKVCRLLLTAAPLISLFRLAPARSNAQCRQLLRHGCPTLPPAANGDTVVILSGLHMDVRHRPDQGINQRGGGRIVLCSVATMQWPLGRDQNPDRDQHSR
jgi:hypothetical protein